MFQLYRMADRVRDAMKTSNTTTMPIPTGKIMTRRTRTKHSRAWVRLSE